jgi:subtilisin family serine protease/subtilase family serine protease
MRRRAVIYLCVLAGALGALWLPTSAQGPARPAVERVGGRDARAREALVRFRRAPRASDLTSDGALDAETVTRIGRTGIYHLRSRSLGAATLMARLARRGDIEYAEPNYLVTIVDTPNDPGFPNLWGLENIGQTIAGMAGLPGADIHARDAWEVSKGSTNTVVAVIDTGVDYNHEDLAANIWSAPSSFTVSAGGGTVTCAAGTHGFNAINRTCNPMDDHNHGTHVSGTIGGVGNNGKGVVGVNWTTRIMGIKFLDADGGGSVADAISGIEFAINARQAFAASGGANIRVLSNSWGGSGFSQALLDEINAANDADMLFVVAAGNSAFDNDLLPTYPASYTAPNMITVAATNNLDQRAWFSNYGKQSVHLGAPGDNIVSTTIGNTYDQFSGTSMATPHVSGAAALVLSVCQLDTPQLKDALIGTVDAVAGMAGVTITGGRLNVHSAVYSCLAAPPTPQSLVAQAGDNRVLLSWSASLGATRYIVKRATTAGGPYSEIATNVKGAAYTDSSAINGTTYYYVVRAANPLGESGDSNEASSTPHAPSDLIVTSVQAPPPGGAGSTFELTVTTKNQGLGTADATTTTMYLSSNGVFEPTDTVLTNLAIASLPAGASVTSTASITIPSNVTGGTYYLFAVADTGQIEAESSETNNLFVRSIKIGPDLEIAALTVPLTGVPGGVLSINSTITNTGGGSAGSFAVTFYLSTNYLLDASDTLLNGSRTIASLAAGAATVGATDVTIPAGTPVGTYQLIAKADGNDQVAEALESNNTSPRSISIGGDLVVTSLTVPAMAGAGSVISVTDITANQGTATVGASTTRFYLSTNWQLDAADIQLDGSHAVPQLAASGNHTATTPLTIPAGTLSGAYYLLAIADATNAVPETQESNNSTSRGIQIGTDLVVTALTVPAKGGAGLPLAITETTRNQGFGSAAPSATRYYFSNNLVLDAGDTLLTPDHNVPQLEAGASHTASLSVTLPGNAGAGTYYLIAKADAANVVVETNESNNTFSRSIQIGGDLTISTFTAPANGGAGRTMVVSDTTVNQGAGPVAATVTRFYLSANTLLDPGDTLLAGVHSVPALDVGLSHTASTTLTLPADAATGVYYLIAKADGDSAVLESLETNNTTLRGFQVGPDLAVSGVSGPSRGAAGSSVTVTDTTANQGGGDAGATSVSFYLSADWIFDASDTPLAATRAVPALVGGGISTGSTTVTIPAGTASGVYYIIARVDAPNAIAETQEGNNSGSFSLRIGPDLWVSYFYPTPNKSAAGGTVNVLSTVTNQGGAAAGTSTVRFYFSTNYTLEAGDIQIGERAVPALAAGQFNSATTSVQIPQGTAAGTYYLLAQADALGVVDESPETNNVTSVVIQVTIVP